MLLVETSSRNISRKKIEYLVPHVAQNPPRERKTSRSIRTILTKFTNSNSSPRSTLPPLQRRRRRRIDALPLPQRLRRPLRRPQQLPEVKRPQVRVRILVLLKDDRLLNRVERVQRVASAAPRTQTARVRADMVMPVNVVLAQIRRLDVNVEILGHVKVLVLFRVER